MFTLFRERRPLRSAIQRPKEQYPGNPAEAEFVKALLPFCTVVSTTGTDNLYIGEIDHYNWPKITYEVKPGDWVILVDGKAHVIEEEDLNETYEAVIVNG